MNILLTEKEMQNIVASLDESKIKLLCDGEFIKWITEKTEDGYLLDYKYDEKGNIKEKYRKSKQEGKQNG